MNVLVERSTLNTVSAPLHHSIITNRTVLFFWNGTQNSSKIIQYSSKSTCFIKICRFDAQFELQWNNYYMYCLSRMLQQSQITAKKEFCTPYDYTYQKSRIWHLLEAQLCCSRLRGINYFWARMICQNDSARRSASILRGFRSCIGFPVDL